MLARFSEHERRVTNVAAGAAATDAVNVSQLSAVDGKVDAIAQSGTQHYFKANGVADGSDDAVAAARTLSLQACSLSRSVQQCQSALGANCRCRSRSTGARRGARAYARLDHDRRSAVPSAMGYNVRCQQ